MCPSKGLYTRVKDHLWGTIRGDSPHPLDHSAVQSSLSHALQVPCQLPSMSSKALYLLQAECCLGEKNERRGQDLSSTLIQTTIPDLSTSHENYPDENSYEKPTPHPIQPRSSTARHGYRTCTRSCLLRLGGGWGGCLPQNIFWKRKGEISPSRKVSIEEFNKCGQAKGNIRLCSGKQLSELLTFITAQNKQGKERESNLSPPLLSTSGQMLRVIPSTSWNLWTNNTQMRVNVLTYYHLYENRMYTKQQLWKCLH